MSLAQFLEDGNLTDFLKGGLIATLPSLPPSAPISPPPSPVRDLEAKTNSLIQEATQNFESTINQKLHDAEKKLNDKFTETTNLKLDNVKNQINEKVQLALNQAFSAKTEDEDESISPDDATWNITRKLINFFRN